MVYTKKGKKSRVKSGQIRALINANAITTITAVSQLVTVNPTLAFAIKRNPIISPIKTMIVLRIFSILDVFQE